MRIAQRGLTLDDLDSPGSGAWSMSEVNEAYHDDNTSEDVDLHLGASDVEPPYSSGDGPMGTRFDDDHEYNITKGADRDRNHLYTGWGTTENQELIEFDSKPVRNIQPMGDFYLFEVYDAPSQSWIEIESMDEPELVGMSDSLSDTEQDFMSPQVSLPSKLSAKDDFLDKVNAEVNSLYEDGLQDVDVKQAILARYGRDVYNSVFQGVDE